MKKFNITLKGEVFLQNCSEQAKAGFADLSKIEGAAADTTPTEHFTPPSTCLDDPHVELNDAKVIQGLWQKRREQVC